MAAQKASSPYLRFLNLARAVQDLPSFPALDSLDERLLNRIAATVATGESLSVLKAVALMPEVSESTVHRRLKSLTSKGWLAQQAVPWDGRSRELVLTEQARRYFAHLEECLRQAGRA